MRRLALIVLIPLALAACKDELGVMRGEAQLEVDPAAVDFGNVAVALTHRFDADLVNAGTVPLDVTFAFSAELSSEFTVEGVPETLQAGSRKKFSIIFDPTTAGLREGTLDFQTQSADVGIVSAAVRARAVDPALQSEPAMIDFGRVVVGRTASAAVSLINTGDQPLEVIRAQVDGSGSEFGANVARAELMPGERIDLQANYTPVDVGQDESRVMILDSAPRAEALGVRVRGEGVDADIEVEPASLMFTGLFVGQTQRQPLFIRNIGDQSHEIFDVALVSSGTDVSGDFSVDVASLPPRPILILPNETITVDVVYNPLDPGIDSDQVRIQSDGLRAPVLVQIDGSADIEPIGEIDVAPQTLDFGQVEVGQSRPLTLSVQNRGTGDLTLTATMTFVPAGAPFSTSNAPVGGFVFAPGDNSLFQVVFAPTAVGPISGELVILSDDPMQPDVRVPVSGEGINAPVPSIFVDPNPLGFGNVPRGVNASRSMLIRNDGSAPLTVNLVLLTDNAGGRFTVPTPPATNTVLAPSQQITFNVDYFDNGVIQTYNGMLEIQSDDPGGAVQVPLSATTEPPPPALTDISVTMTWSSTGADIDLHLVRPGGDFFDSPSDCCYCNPNPDWGVPAQSPDNPFLDRDDLNGPGPETINLTEATDGEHEIIAHYFSDGGAGPVTVTVQVAVKGVVIATETETLENPERWIVGRVNWNGALDSGTFLPHFLPPFPTLFLVCF